MLVARAEVGQAVINGCGEGLIRRQHAAAQAARTELIRVQFELAAPVLLTRSTAERAAELTRRQAELLAAWERVWLGAWADVLDGWTFRRGFVEAVRADASV